VIIDQCCLQRIAKKKLQSQSAQLVWHSSCTWWKELSLHGSA